MPLAIVNNVVLYFAHVPKTGGSSIEAYLHAKGRVALLQKEPLGWSRCTAQHVERRIFNDLFPQGFADFGFAVVRDPLDRLLSEYNYRKKLRATVDHRVGVDPLRMMGRTIKRLVGANRNRIRAADLSFDEWASRVLAAYARDTYLNDNHIRPQAEFVDPAHVLFRFEAGLNPVFDWIDTVTQTPSVDRGVHLKKSIDHAEAVAESTRRIVRDFYAEDYALLAAAATV